jgi:hypothetical protein
MTGRTFLLSALTCAAGACGGNAGSGYGTTSTTPSVARRTGVAAVAAVGANSAPAADTINATLSGHRLFCTSTTAVNAVEVSSTLIGHTSTSASGAAPVSAARGAAFMARSRRCTNRTQAT